MPVPHRPLRFLLAGLWNTAFGYGVYLLCDAAARALGWHYIVALFPAQLLAILNAYVVHRRFVFYDSAAGLWSFLRYNLVYWVTFAVNLLALPLIVEFTHADPRLAQAVFIACAAVTTYLAHRVFSFGAPVNSAPPG